MYVGFASSIFQSALERTNESFQLSWLHTNNSDPSVSPLISEINRLQVELDRANDSIDDKLDKLEDAGLGVVGLTKKLEDARGKIVSLEDEIARLNRKEERRIHGLNRVRCQKCNVKVDLRHLVQGDDKWVFAFSTVSFDDGN